MNAAHFKFILRELSTRTDGKQAIYLYCLINGIKKYYSLKYYIDPEHWDLVTEKVSKLDPDHQEINHKIEDYRNKAKDLVTVADAHKAKVSLVELDELFRAGSYNRQSFTDFVMNDIQAYRKRYAYNTIRKYEAELSKLQGFRKSVLFSDVNPGFWRKYEKFLIEKGNNQNTIQKAFKVLNVFINRAISLDIIKENPLKEVTVHKGESRLKYLTLAELDKLAVFFKTDISKQHEKALRCFLFSCYTGLRYSDIRSLRYKHIIGGTHIEIKMKKVSKTVTIPLNKYALQLIPVIDHPLQEQKVFRVYSNQPMNRYLKEIAKQAGINKPVSFHFSRHTFGTGSISKGIDVYVLKELMGHSSVNVTQGYAKVMNELKDREMSKWNLPDQPEISPD